MNEKIAEKLGWEQMVAYLKDEMPESERAEFEREMAESEKLRAMVEETRKTLETLSVAAEEPIKARVNGIIVKAIETGASDIHLLPEREHMAVRLRIDGVLHDLETIPRAQQQAVVDRWKKLAEMDLSERRLPQDGSIALRHKEEKFRLRVAILPTLYGERVTARVLLESGVLLGLDHLGMTDAQVDALRRLAHLRNGLIITSGATNTGKTTLLYSLLREMQIVDRTRRNILTAEDPVEYVLGEGVSQTAIDRRAGLTYPPTLRAILRSDPDVVMCAEMRSLEIAELCVETALTGHLVLTALHTTSALGIIERMRNIGVVNHLIADTVAGLIGQRLVRRIDDHATEEYEPAPEELAPLGLTHADGPFRRGVPTDENGQTGFRGRIPLIEIVEVDQALRRRIAEGGPIDARWWDGITTAGGSLLDDARAKVKAGLTTVEEVNWALFDHPLMGR
jgi:general secretion pathway protein E